MINELIQRLKKNKQSTNIQLVCHVITLDRLQHMKRLLETESAFFDKIRICDGGSSQDILDLFKQYPCEVYLNEWQDDMAVQENFLLSKAKPGEWIFVLDDDEILSPQLRCKLRDYIRNSGEVHKYFKVSSIRNCNGAYPKPINLYIEEGKGDNQSIFAKLILYQYDGTQHYQGRSHYELIESKDPMVIPEPIIHYKDHVEYLWAEVYQAFIDPKMQGYSEDKINELWPILSSINIKTTKQLDKYLRDGQVIPAFDRIITKWKDNVMDSSCCWYQYYYFILHPEQIKEFNQDDISFQFFIRNCLEFRCIDVPGYPRVLPIYDFWLPEKLRELIGKDYVKIKYAIWDTEKGRELVTL